MRLYFGLFVGVLCLIGCAVHPQPTVLPPTAVPSPSPKAGPAALRWIEVVLEEQTIYLWEDNSLCTTLSMSSGVGDSPATTTYTGEFVVETMYPGPEQTVPGVYVRDIIIFDWDHGNGFTHCQWMPMGRS
jgi:hypothetical protein